MIDFYTWTTPNGRKVSIMLEETGLDYTAHPVDIGNGEQFKPAFLAVSPNNRIPAIVDQNGEGGPVSVFESGAILIYLAEKTGKFLAPSGPARAKALEWLMWQMGGIGPMMGQLNHFVNTAPEQVPYAIGRFMDESARLIAVFDKHLADNEFAAGDYSIADMALYPWISLGFPIIKGVKPDVVGEGVNTQRWLDTLGAREAVKAGMVVPLPQG